MGTLLRRIWHEMRGHGPARRESAGQWPEDGHCVYVHCSCGGMTRYDVRVTGSGRWDREYVVALTTCPLVESHEQDWAKLRAKMLPAARAV